MENLLQDLRYAFRAISKRPGFAAVAILTLALGTGANTAIFSVVNAVLLRPLPYREPGRLVMVWMTRAADNYKRDPVSVPDLLDLRAQNRSLEGLATLAYDDFNVTSGAEPLHVAGSFVSANFFEVVGSTPRLGRGFVEGEDKEGGSRIVVISDGLWKRHFGADPAILHSIVQLNGTGFEIVGVASPEFKSPEKSDELWVPMSFDGGDQLRVPSSTSAEGLTNRRMRFLKVVGRLRGDAGLDRARADMTAVAATLEQKYPDTNVGRGVNLVTLERELLGDIGTPLKLLQAVVFLILLIACANVANLLLARGTARQKEVAIRAALGAGRWRLLRHSLTESVLLSMAGGAVGLVLAYAAIKLLIAINPANVPRVSEVNLDWRVLLFTFVLSVVTGLIFGLVPALQSLRPDLSRELKEGGRGSSEGGRARLRSALVVLELALTTLLLIGAALTLRSFYEIQKIDPGFNYERVLTMQFALPATRYAEDSQITSFFDQSLKRIETLPGVESAAVATTLPLQGDSAISYRFTIDGRTPASPNERLTAWYRSVSCDFFKTMGIRLLTGRFFIESDRSGSPPVAIINDAMRRRYWPDEDPIGRRVSLTAEGGVSREIVGVISDIKQSALNSEAGDELYVPYLQFPWTFMALVVRTSNDPAQIAGAVRNEILAVDSAQPVFDVKPLSQLVGESISQPRLYTVLLLIFAAVALALAVVGIYGVISSSVTQRTQEIGIRIALGANPGDILGLVIGRAMALALVGLAIGLAAAWSLSWWVSAKLPDLLYSVSPRDVATFALMPLLLAFVAFLSSYIPARRATRVDPTIALRAE
jgi:putative ABC transport system permease protein